MMRMLILYVGAAALAALASFTVIAQQQNPSASASPSPAPSSLQDVQIETSTPAIPKLGEKGNVRAVPVQSTASAPEIANAALRPIEGELEQKIDSSTARTGDAVTLRTTAKATTSDGQVIPEGSQVVGRVVEVTPSGKEKENAKITIQFEKAELKDGKTMALKSVLQSVAPASEGEISEGPAGTGRSASGSGVPASAASGAARGTGMSPMGGSAVVNESSETAVPRATSGRNATAGNTASRVGTVVAQQGNTDIRTTAIPGVFIATDANGQPFSNASGVLLGSRQNIHLESGTHIVLAVSNEGTKEASAKPVAGNRPKPVHRTKSRQ